MTFFAKFAHNLDVNRAAAQRKSAFNGSLNVLSVTCHYISPKLHGSSRVQTLNVDVLSWRRTTLLEAAARVLLCISQILHQAGELCSLAYIGAHMLLLRCANCGYNCRASYPEWRVMSCCERSPEAKAEQIYDWFGGAQVRDRRNISQLGAPKSRAAAVWGDGRAAAPI